MGRQRLSQVPALLIVSPHPLDVFCALSINTRRTICKQNSNPSVSSRRAVCGGSRSWNTFPSGLRTFVLAICAKPGTDPFTAEIPHT